MDDSNKFDKVSEGLVEIKMILNRHEIYHEINTKNLEEHMLRTKQNETLIEILREDDRKILESIKIQLTPVNKHIIKVETAVKVIGIMLTVTGALIMGLYSLGILQKLF